MGDFLQPWHLVVLGVVAFLLFGAKRLPELGKGLGEGLKGFKEGMKSDGDAAPPGADATSAQTAGQLGGKTIEGEVTKETSTKV